MCCLQIRHGIAFWTPLPWYTLKTSTALLWLQSIGMKVVSSEPMSFEFIAWLAPCALTRFDTRYLDISAYLFWRCCTCVVSGDQHCFSYYRITCCDDLIVYLHELITLHVVGRPVWMFAPSKLINPQLSQLVTMMVLCQSFVAAIDVYREYSHLSRSDVLDDQNLK